MKLFNSFLLGESPITVIPPADNNKFTTPVLPSNVVGEGVTILVAPLKVPRRGRARPLGRLGGGGGGGGESRVVLYSST